ncbi:hypothetical protein FO519_009187 [Halicephalobus sp. NKZ332]|nr:hypothetical protein FO519_009187 [Halicephalobus sp. NKZ332]
MMITSLFMTIHAGSVVVTWREGFKIPFNLFFITGTLDGALLPSVSWTVFFLTLDRTCIILFKYRYNKEWSLVMATVCVFLVISITVLNLVAAAVDHFDEIPPGCVAFGCLLKDFAQYSFNIPKLTVISANVVIGIMFLFVVYIYRNQQASNFPSRNLGESLIIRIVVFEFVFNFIPHAVDTVYVIMHSDSPLLFIGPFSRVIMALDLISSSITNLNSFRKLKKKIFIIPGTIPTISVGQNLSINTTQGNR